MRKDINKVLLGLNLLGEVVDLCWSRFLEPGLHLSVISYGLIVLVVRVDDGRHYLLESVDEDGTVFITVASTVSIFLIKTFPNQDGNAIHSVKSTLRTRVMTDHLLREGLQSRAIFVVNQAAVSQASIEIVA